MHLLAEPSVACSTRLDAFDGIMSGLTHDREAEAVAARRCGDARGAATRIEVSVQLREAS